MKNLHIIATDKSLIKGDLLLRHLWKGTPDECISWWRYNDTRNYGDTVVYTTLNGSFMDSPSSFKVQHIYITSDEELNKDTKPCWCLDTKNNSVNYYQGALPLHNYIGYKKIILSTDQDLDGVQAIDDEFLEWFVKNPSCEEIETIIVSTWCNDGKVCVCNVPKFCNEKRNDFKYKIVIPKEEHKQELNLNCFDCNKSLQDCTCMEDTIDMKQESIEEAASRLYAAEWDWKEKESFIEGSQWQAERMYSEEDMREAFKSSSLTNMLNVYDSFEEFIEQFKKK